MPKKVESFTEQKAAMADALAKAETTLRSAEGAVKEWPKLTAEIDGQLTPALQRASSQLTAEARSLGQRDFLKDLKGVRKSLARLPGITWRDGRALHTRLWDVAVLPYIAWLWLRVHRRQVFWALGLMACTALFIAMVALAVEHRTLILAVLRVLWEIMRR